MDERLVQWTLLREWNYLQKCLQLPVLRRYAEQVRTDYGIPDFILWSEGFRSLYLVELETAIDSQSKLNHVEEQLRRYRNIRFTSGTGPQRNTVPSTLVLLYAEDVTPPEKAGRIKQVCSKLEVKPKTYSLNHVQHLYQRLVIEMTKLVGVPLGPTSAMDICYLRWMNRLIKPFVEQGVNTLPVSQFYTQDGTALFRSQSNYNVYKRLCQDFELLKEQDGSLRLTEYGKRFAEALIPDILVGSAQIPPLSLEQRRILLEVLTNGKITPCKANIYYFMRFVYLTEGLWIPHSSTPEPRFPQDTAYGYWQLATALFGKRYAWRTLTDFLNFTCNQSEELGLVERMKFSKGSSDRAVITPLGSRVLGLMEIDLHLKRERVHIPLQAS